MIASPPALLRPQEKIVAVSAPTSEQEFLTIGNTVI